MASEIRCPKCKRPALDLRGVAFNARKAEADGTCFLWGGEKAQMYTCALSGDHHEPQAPTALAAGPPRSDFSLLEDEGAPAHPAWRHFVQAMEGRAYGRGPLNSAWAWFRSGWEARNGLLVGIAENSAASEASGR